MPSLLSLCTIRLLGNIVIGDSSNTRQECRGIYLINRQCALRIDISSNLTSLLSCSDFNFTSPVSAPHDSTQLRAFDLIALPYSSRLNIRHTGHVTVFSSHAFNTRKLCYPSPLDRPSRYNRRAQQTPCKMYRCRSVTSFMQHTR